MKQERINGYIAGRKSIDDTSTYAVNVKKPGHALDGQKLAVWEVGPDVWTLHRGDNVTFVLGQNNEGVDVAFDVMKEHTRTLNRFQRFVFKSRSAWGIDRSLITMQTVLLLFCAGIFLGGYYSLPDNWGSGYSRRLPIEEVMAVIIGLMGFVVTAWMLTFDLYALAMERLHECLDYSCRDQNLNVRKECLYYGALALAYGTLFYFGHGTLSGMSLKFDWLAVVVNGFIDVLLLAPPLFATFIALSTPFVTRGKAMPLFESELKK
jgi:hypothetical protein